MRMKASLATLFGSNEPSERFSSPKSTARKPRLNAMDFSVLAWLGQQCCSRIATAEGDGA